MAVLALESISVIDLAPGKDLCSLSDFIIPETSRPVTSAAAVLNTVTKVGIFSLPVGTTKNLNFYFYYTKIKNCNQLPRVLSSRSICWNHCWLIFIRLSNNCTIVTFVHSICIRISIK